MSLTLILRGQEHTGEEGLLCMRDISEFIHFFPRHLLLSLSEGRHWIFCLTEGGSYCVCSKVFKNPHSFYLTLYVLKMFPFLIQHNWGKSLLRVTQRAKRNRSTQKSWSSEHFSWKSYFAIELCIRVSSYTTEKYFHSMMASKEVPSTETYAVPTFQSCWEAEATWQKHPVSLRWVPVASAVLKSLLTIAFCAWNHLGLSLSLWVRLWKLSLLWPVGFINTCPISPLSLFV